MNKHELDRKVAANLGVHVRQVRAVTTAFMDAVTEALLDHGGVQITNFGTFSVDVQASRHFTVNQGTFKKGERAGKKDVVACPIHVHFRRAPRLKRRLKVSTMDKYAVDENVDQEALEKKAANGCPECGAPLEKHGSVVKCPTHGTEPFEAQGDPWQQGRKQSPK